MPEFCPSHVPAGCDDFTKGYLTAAEWLLSEPTDEEGNFVDADGWRDEITGWNAETLAEIKADCAAFQQAYVTYLERYCEATGRDLECAGHDFFLTRNHHGAGFWDRGDDPCLAYLTEQSHAYGETNYDVNDSGEIVA